MDVSFRIGSAEIQGFLAQPESAEPRPGVLIIPGIMGLDGHMRENARRVAQMGYPALAVDIFSRIGGGPAPDMPSAQARIGKIPDPVVMGDITAAMEFLHAQSGVAKGPTGIWGFSLGGRYAVLASALVNGFGAAVTVSALVTDQARSENMPSSATDRAGEIACPVLAIFGSEDPATDEAKRKAFRTALAMSGQAFRIETLPGGHTFMNEKTPAYNAESASTHWRLVAEFLRANLG